MYKTKDISTILDKCMEHVGKSKGLIRVLVWVLSIYLLSDFIYKIQ